MAKKKTSSYVLTLNLATDDREKTILDKRFEISRKLYNSILGVGLKRFEALSELRVYRQLRKELSIINKDYHNCTDKKKLKTIEKERKRKYRELNTLLGEHKLNEYSLINEMTPMYKPFSKNIDNKTAQALASRAWKALEKLIYSSGERVHFIRYGEMQSVEGKWNKSGITYRDGIIKWNKLKMPVVVKTTDIYAQKALQDRVKYCRIVRKLIRGKYKYYVQLVMEGVPPVKANKETGESKRSTGIGNVGVDIGISTIAVSSSEEVKLLELCPEVNNIEKEKNRLNRKLDRQRRAVNQSNYNEDGTIKRGVKLVWNKSKKYVKTQRELSEIMRKQKVIRKQSHEILANEIIVLGDRILVEQMSFNGLQRRAKKTTVNESTGKINKKKRFGKSLANKAPSMLLEIINRKLKYEGLELLKIKTREVKASQYNHFTGECNKKELKDRWNKDTMIQRDMYSAFLIMNVDESLKKIDRELCDKTYVTFKMLHDREITRLKGLKLRGVKFPSSMGI
ncbi:MAG: transposase [Alkaliphilus sp.]|nr:MAG: transposase [Alkaliphilus sp.]PHS34970.1 MAG: transposase [Alkaliphilus sp.]